MLRELGLACPDALSHTNGGEEKSGGDVLPVTEGKLRRSGSGSRADRGEKAAASAPADGVIAIIPRFPPDVSLICRGGQTSAAA